MSVYALPAKPASRFALMRMILIDSFAEGRIVELPFTGGTAITGRNGRGKTTLLQLVPAFLGEHPSNIVRRSSNKLPFASYYLPRATSYIVFEYRRDNDLLCCVIIHADVTGEQAVYRFVRGGYRRDMFVREDDVTIVVNKDLRERLSLLDIDHSHQMEVDEYRSIIQGRTERGSDRAKQRRMIANYAFCPSSHTLRHIERLVSGMFQRRTNFNDLQRMVIESIGDLGYTGARTVELSGDKKRIGDWPGLYAAYVNVMSEEPRVAVARKHYEDIVAAEAELRCLHARARALEAHLADKKEKEDHAANLARSDFANALQAKTDAEGQHQLALHTINSDIGREQQEVDEIDSQKKDFDASGVAVKADLLEQEAQLRARLTEKTNERAALVQGASELDVHYQNLRDRKIADFVARERQRNDRRGELQLGCSNAINQLHKQCDQAIAQLRKAEQPKLEDARTAVAQANQVVGAAKAALANPHVHPELIEELELRQGALETHQTTLNAKTEAFSGAQHNERRAQCRYDEASRALAGLQNQLQEERGRLDGLRAFATPGEDSLLFRLRRDRPDWTSDIAKVLRPELLQRTDLSPAFDEARAGVYGMVLDLDRIIAPIESDEAQLRERINDVERLVSEIAGRIEKAEAAVQEANAARAAAVEARELAEREMRSAKTALDQAQQHRDAARLGVQKGRKAAVDIATEAVSAAEKALGDANGVVREAERNLAEKEGTIRSDADAKRGALEQELADALEALDQQSTADTATHQQELAELQATCEKALREKGVDVETIGRIDTVLDDVKAKIAVIEQSRNEVARWRNWLTDRWAKRRRFENAIKELRKKHDELLKAWEATRKTLDAEIAKARDKAKKAEEAQEATKKTLADVRAHIERLQDFPPAADLIEFDPVWTIEELIRWTNHQRGAAGDAENALRVEIGALHRVFQAHADSPPKQYFDTVQREVGAGLSSSPRAWVKPYKDWYDTIHLRTRDLLRAEACTIAGAIKSFHSQLENFESCVARFNRELQASFDRTLRFQSITGLQVSVITTLSELAYWKTIERTVSEVDLFGASEATELPGEGFSAMLRELLTHWEMSRGIQADLTQLIRIQGEVIENGNARRFRTHEELVDISSHGLSYIVLVIIFIAFVNRVRGQAAVNIVWALDEIRDLDAGNIEVLMQILAENQITLVSACPDPDPDILAMFANRRSIRSDRCLYEIAALEDEEEEVAHV